MRWRLTARPEQLTPDGDWFVWCIIAGRGFGKSRAGAEDAAFYALSHPGVRVGVIARTVSDARDVCVEGPAGLLKVIPQECLRGHSVESAWNRSLGQLHLDNGSRFDTYSSERPDALRGPQHHRIWADELAAWYNVEDTWDMAMFGLRLGSKPQAVVTTTPRPLPILKNRKGTGLLERDSTVVSTGSTFDNAANLAPSVLEQFRQRYEGTRLGRQELNAEVLEDIEGALWRQADIDEHRVKQHPDLERVVVAIDPATTSGPESDETGIVAAGVDGSGHAYVLGDRSCRLSPDQWAREAVRLYTELTADRIIAETNNGGDLVREVIKTVDPNIPFRKVVATRGKQLRALPIAALYEQGRVHHVGLHNDLEDQMTRWTPETRGVDDDRLDALVWALTELTQVNRPVLLGAV